MKLIDLKIRKIPQTEASAEDWNIVKSISQLQKAARFKDETSKQDFPEPQR